MGGWRCLSLGSGRAPAVFRFFQRDFPGSSDISNRGASFPSCSRVHSQSHFLREPGSPDLFRGSLRSLRRPRSTPLPSSRGLSLDRLPSRLKNSQQLRSAALPLQSGADAPPGSSGSRGGGGGGALRAGLPILPCSSLS